MRRIRYSVAMSLDGYIAGSKIVKLSDYVPGFMDPEIDFTALFNQFDTMLLGGKTFEAALKQGGAAAMPGMQTYVFSRTLRQQDHPGVTIVAETQTTKLTETGIVSLAYAVT